MGREGKVKWQSASGDCEGKWRKVGCEEGTETESWACALLSFRAQFSPSFFFFVGWWVGGLKLGGPGRALGFPAPLQVGYCLFGLSTAFLKR